MFCEVCQQEAVGRCKSCGIAYCADHGGSYCFRCATAIVPDKPDRKGPNTGIVGDARDRPVPSGKGYLQCVSEERPTIYLDDPGPPSCHVCRGLARRVCRNCQNLYCPEHGRGEVCITCLKSSRLGLIILGMVLLFLLGLPLLAWLSAQIQAVRP